MSGIGREVRVALVGEQNSGVAAHRAIPLALEGAAKLGGIKLSAQWLDTESIGDARVLEGFDGIWCVPASPYRNMGGALTAIRYAREQQVAFLGTCGGFQHALIEYARNVLGWADAEHAETSPDAGQAIITPLACALVEASAAIRCTPDSRLGRAYGAKEIVERYRCSYGLKPGIEAALIESGMLISGRDPVGSVRAVELPGPGFFVATLFQPEQAALQGQVPPLVSAFVAACAGEGSSC
ncbi:CTP synthase (UTP-ammonia lyase) [Pseudomonas sp. JUb42]|jgi:CTP synthase (UTP-ammonia lyase)|uniref:CTP synthase C-terminal region-related (seleno)protein n=1 Tax=Pseudomonas sp. JUb42 TaxID=2940611 RepID=UPI00216A3712|nr:CTP synthase [Pseudomonas sp. JUb42]MCS3472965.1 CTP synthase (UTP-ammonia lyase) [Pseudomonas sp. JUb42]